MNNRCLSASTEGVVRATAAVVPTKLIELLRAIHSQDKPRIHHLIQSFQIVDPRLGPFPPLNSAILESDPNQIMALIDVRYYLEEGGDLETAAWLAICQNNLECLGLLSELGADLTKNYTRRRGAFSGRLGAG